MIKITKVVSQNFIEDIIANIQNFFGVNLTSYEKMIQKGVKQIENEIEGKKFKYCRYEITQLTNGAVAILFYGDEK